jgi:hypothetical protein
MLPVRRSAVPSAWRIIFAAAALAMCLFCDGGRQEGQASRQRGGWAQAAQELLARPGAPPALAEVNLTVEGLLRHLAPAITRGFVPHTLAGGVPPPPPLCPHITSSHPQCTVRVSRVTRDGRTPYSFNHSQGWSTVSMNLGLRTERRRKQHSRNRRPRTARTSTSRYKP